MARLSRVTAVAGTALLAGCLAQPPDLPVRRESGAEGPPVFRAAADTTWTGWDDAVPPLTTFDAVRDWRVESRPAAATCRFERAVSPYSGGRAAGRLMAAGGDIETVRLSPRAPLPIGGPADSLEVVVGGRPADAGVPRPPAPARISVVVSADGRSDILHVGEVPLDRWTVLQTRLPLRFARPGGAEGQVEAIVVEGWSGGPGREIWLAGLSAYVEHRMLPPVARGGAVGAAAGLAARLAEAERWPPGAVGGHPEPPIADVTVRRTETGAVRLISENDAGAISYEFDPAAWMRGCEIAWNGQPCGWWGGLEFIGAAPARLRQASVSASGLDVEMENGQVVHVRLQGRTLSIAIRGGTAAAVRARGVAGAGASCDARLPLLNGPKVRFWRCPDAAGTPMFATAFFDPFVSGATSLAFERAGDPREAGEVRYEAPAGNARRPLAEVFRLTVSPRVMETLPRVPAPPGRRAVDAAVACYVDAGPLGAGRTLDIWAEMEAGPMYLLAPPLPRDGAPEDELDCLDARWSRAVVRRGPDGGWVAGSAPGRYALRLPVVAALAAAGGSPLAAPPDRAVRPVLAARPPWDRVDFDARVEGAATFRAAWDGLRDWLRGESQRRGTPVLCDAAWSWLYADAVDAALLDPAAATTLLEQPWLPIFALSRLNNALCTIGPPLVGASIDPDDDYRRLATAIAYGLALRLPPPEAAGDRLWRLVFLGAALHRRQALGRVERLSFGDGRDLASASDALATGSWRSSRIYIRHADGLEIWANGGATPWTIAVAGTQVILPRWGWHAIGRDFLASSSLTDGRRADRVRSPEYAFHDGHGSSAEMDGVGCSEPIVLRDEPRPRGRRMRVLFLRGAASVALSAPLWPAGARLAQVTAWDAYGARTAPPDVIRDGDRLRLAPRATVRRMELEWTQ